MDPGKVGNLRGRLLNVARRVRRHGQGANQIFSTRITVSDMGSRVERPESRVEGWMRVLSRGQKKKESRDQSRVARAFFQT